MSDAYLDLYGRELLLLKNILVYIDRFVLYTPESIITDILPKSNIKKENDCVVFKWDNEVHLDSVAVYIPSSIYSIIDRKKFVLCCNEREIRENDEINGHNLLYKLDKIKTDEIRIKTENSWFLDFIVKYAAIYQSDIARDVVNITASSYYDIYSPENLIKENGLFWCPHESDDNRYVEFTFQDNMNVSSVIIEQEYYSVRIQKYSIIVFTDSGWEEAYINDDAEESTVLFSQFTQMRNVERLRVCILKTKVDVNSQDVPLIMRVRIYQL